jgi:hypothetical protein
MALADNINIFLMRHGIRIDRSDVFDNAEDNTMAASFARKNISEIKHDDDIIYVGAKKDVSINVMINNPFLAKCNYEESRDCENCKNTIDLINDMYKDQYDKIVLFSSPFLRCMQTSLIVAKKLGLHDTKIHVCMGLAEELNHIALNIGVKLGDELIGPYFQTDNDMSKYVSVMSLLSKAELIELGQNILRLVYRNSLELIEYGMTDECKTYFRTHNITFELHNDALIGFGYSPIMHMEKLMRTLKSLKSYTELDNRTLAFALTHGASLDCFDRSYKWKQCNGLPLTFSGDDITISLPKMIKIFDKLEEDEDEIAGGGRKRRKSKNIFMILDS